jgi:hypothetical protein
MLIPQKPKKQRESTAPAPVPNEILLDFDLSTLQVNFKQEVSQTIVITIQEQTILTLGSLLVITGKPKARKSTFLHSFLGSAIKKHSIWGIKAQLPEARQKVILIDTEQSLYDLHIAIKRMAFTFGIDLHSTQFVVYTARALDVSAIMLLIETILTKNPDCSLLAIDGLVDLVNDINDVREAKSSVNFLKSIADKFNVAILGVLHQNKATNFSLGHLGSFLSRFAQSELSVVKNEDSSSTLESTFLRSADSINPITIGWDIVNNRYDTLDSINLGALRYSEITILQEIFNGKLALSYKELLTRAKTVIPETSYYIEKKLIPHWYDSGSLKKVSGLVQITVV